MNDELFKPFSVVKIISAARGIQPGAIGRVVGMDPLDGSGQKYLVDFRGRPSVSIRAADLALADPGSSTPQVNPKF